MCDDVGILTGFGAIVDWAQVGCVKPDLRIFLRAVEELEDRPEDVALAEAMAIAWGGT